MFQSHSLHSAFAVFAIYVFMTVFLLFCRVYGYAGAKLDAAD